MKTISKFISLSKDATITLKSSIDKWTFREHRVTSRDINGYRVDNIAFSEVGDWCLRKGVNYDYYTFKFNVRLYHIAYKKYDTGNEFVSIMVQVDE